MADAPAPAKAGGKSSFGFLTRKLGFMPVWGWGLAAFGGYYWYTHFGPGKKAGGQTVTDPAGNTCSALAPSGFCPGSPEDLAAQQTQTMPAGSSDGGAGLPVPPMPPAPGRPPGPTGPPVGTKPPVKPPAKRPPPPPPRLIGPPVRQPPVPVRLPPRPPPRPVPVVDPHGPPVIAPRPAPVPLPEPRPVPVIAPGTTGAVYGGVPVSRLDGTTYDSGFPTEAQMGGAYVPAL